MDFNTLSADLKTYPIQGYAPGGVYVNMPLISHIKDNLYVGGHSGSADLGDFFSHVFSLYVWADRYRTGEGTRHTSFQMLDNINVDVEMVESASDLVIEALNEGGNVLVHCQAGMNRSNLVATRVLMKRYNMTAAAAIDLLRERRHQVVLSNRAFVDYLTELDETEG